jgi:transporter family-2 protein
MPSIAVAGLYCLGVLAGVSFVVQQAVNTELRGQLGFPFWAGFISYLGGTIAMFIMVLVMHEPWMDGPMIARTTPLSWSGGIFGTIYISVAILLVPRLGAATVVALLVLGQMIASIAFDHYGMLGIPVHQIGFARVVGAAFLITGVVLIKV